MRAHARSKRRERRLHLTRMPIALIAYDENRGAVGATAPTASGEGGIEHFMMHGARVKTRPAFDRGDDDLGRAEQHRVDGVEIALEALENLGERGAEIARGAAGKRLGESLRVRRPAR